MDKIKGPILYILYSIYFLFLFYKEYLHLIHPIQNPINPLAETFARIDELEREIQQDIVDFDNWKKDTYERIGRLDDLDQRNILIGPNTPP